MATTRRDLLLGRRAASAAGGGDAAVLIAAVGREQVAASAYAAAARSAALDPALKKMATLFGAQAQEHVAALTAALRAVGGTPPRAPRIPSSRHAPRSRSGFLRFAIELESAGVAAYSDAMRKLASPQHLATAAEIMANAGQHLVILRSALGRDPAPSAFESGRASA